MATRTCVYCHQEFSSRNGNSRYCNDHSGVSSCNTVAWNARRRAEKLGLTEHYTGAELLESLERFGGSCMRCGTTKRGYMDHVADHIVPLSLGGSNTIDNIQILCFACNGAKRNYTIDYRRFAQLERHAH